MQHILVCDDEEDIVAALKIYLEADGYCVHAAYTGADALKIVREEPVQLALMDIMMPGMDGLTAMAKLREKLEIDPSNPRDLKVVWGKGYKLEGDRQ